LKTYLELDDVENMEKKANIMRDRLLIRLLFRLGCRISEALSLNTDDIDFTKGTAMIVHLKQRLAISCKICGARLGRSHAFCPKCGCRIDAAQVLQEGYRRQRAIPIDNKTLNMLEEYIATSSLAVKGGQETIFSISRHRAWQIVKQCGERAGIPRLVNPESGKIHNVSPYKLRDAFAVNAIKHDDSGDGLRLLQEHLGHQSFNTTARYRKVSGDEHREWYQRLWR
jgi:integrase/recombinase XerD